ncbi:MAG: hypothetical protein ACI8TP_003495 [Acidimicrobiales bacterium]|jgi:hypothetical protein
MFKRRQTRPYPGPLSDADATEFARAVGLDESVQVWLAVECIQWDGRLAGHARDDCKLGVTPTTTHLILRPPQGHPSPVPIAELQVGATRLGTQTFVLVRDRGGKAVTLSMTNRLGEPLVELLVSLGASRVPSPRGKSAARLGSPAWSQ